MKAIKALDRAFAHLEEALVVIFLVAMVLIAFIQVILRNFFSTGFSWADELLRHLMLWTGFMAGSLATRQGRHIAIDIVSRTISPPFKRVDEFIINIGAMSVTSILLKASWRFVSVERSYGEVLGSLHIPVWILELIFPITFALLTLRFGIRAVEALLRREG